jgi:hypothetical protein
MIIIGTDFHPEFQQIAAVDTDTGEFQEKRLAHGDEAEKFYRGLAAAGQQVRVGMEASGHARWFERLLSELQFELWIGDAAEIQSKRVRKQKTDRQDAQLILKLMLKDDFPRIWVPSWENRDLRQLLWHRHRMVQVRTRVMNQLQALALNEGLRCNEEAVAGTRTAATGVNPAGSMGKPATPRSTGVDGSTEPDHRGTESGHGAGSRKAPRSTAAHDSSRCRSTHRTGFCADHRESGAISVWEADCELSRTGAAGKIQRKSATAGTYHETGQLTVALATLESFTIGPPIST